MKLEANYLILDAAKCGLENIDAAKKICTERNDTLYREKEFTMLQRVAPYLFEINSDKALLHWYLENGYSQSWGILIQSNEIFEAVHQHFRRFLRVKTEEGKYLLFRFYDPRVISLFLPIATPAQVLDLFGNHTNFIVENENGFMKYSHQKGKLIETQIEYKNPQIEQHDTPEIKINATQQPIVPSKQEKPKGRKWISE